MFISYRIVRNNERSADTTKYPTATMAAAVLADFVGMLTGTITSVEGLSVYADRDCTFITGDTYPWEVYDADAHPGYPGCGKVLRRLNSDGATYRYLFIAMSLYTSTYLNVAVCAIGGWNSTTKAPTSIMVTNEAVVIAAGTVISAANLPLTGSSYYRAITTGSTVPQGSLGIFIVNTDTLFAYMYQPYLTSTENYGSNLLVMEHDDVHPYSNAAAGVPPLVFSGWSTAVPRVVSPYIRNSAGAVVTPSYTWLSTVFGRAKTTPYLISCMGDNNYETVNADGRREIMPVSMDVTLALSTLGYACYVGRLKDVYCIQRTSAAPGDMLTVNSEKYLVIAASLAVPNASQPVHINLSQPITSANLLLRIK